MDYIDGQEKYNMKMIHLETLCKLEDAWNAWPQTRRSIEKKFSSIKYGYMYKCLDLNLHKYLFTIQQEIISRTIDTWKSMENKSKKIRRIYFIC
jgi:hypothetical protein